MHALLAWIFFAGNRPALVHDRIRRDLREHYRRDSRHALRAGHGDRAVCRYLVRAVRARFLCGNRQDAVVPRITRGQLREPERRDFNSPVSRWQRNGTHGADFLRGVRRRHLQPVNRPARVRRRPRRNVREHARGYGGDAMPPWDSEQRNVAGGPQHVRRVRAGLVRCE